MRKAWSEAEIKYIQNHKDLSYKELAKKLDRSVDSVKHKCYTLGITKGEQSYRREWSDKEVEYLNRMYNSKGLEYISKKLDRSVISVKKKAETLGLAAHSGEWISYRQLCQCFSVDMRVIHRWRTKFNMPSHKADRGKLTYYRIDVPEFWKWALENKDVIPWGKYELKSLLPEPACVRDYVRCGSDSNHRKPISETLKSQVRYDRNRGMSLDDLSSKYKRSKDSIRHILRSKPF